VLALIISGIVIGCIYALIAAGYIIVYRTTGILNFAQGSFVMLAGMSTSWLIRVEHWAYPLAALGGFLLTVAVGAAIWLLLMAPMLVRRIGLGIAVIATLVVSYAITNIVLIWQGPDPQSLPAIKPSFTFTIAGTRVQSGQLYVIIGMALILLALGLFLRYTRLGRATRACAANDETAQLLGISPIRVGGYAMSIAAGVGALGGLLIAPTQFTSASGAVALALYGFVAAVLGGFGRLAGGVVGGIAIGVLQQLVSRYISTAYSDAITFGILILVLVLRPQGLLGAPDPGRARRRRGSTTAATGAAAAEQPAAATPPVEQDVVARPGPTAASPTASDARVLGA
jgi:branched-chain amino acid transport system permease protein